MSEVRIGARYCGPVRSANGGYTAGVLAAHISGACSVTLRAPPPLEKPLTVSRADDGAVCLHDAATLIAEARPTEIDLQLPEPVSFEDAERATRSYPGAHPHPYPQCFVCGPARPRGDGLAIYAGAVEGRRVVAAPWFPRAELCRDGREVDAELVWAALDCPSWFGFCAFEDELPPVLLGRLAARIDRRPACGERLVVVGWHLRREGRRIECASMLVDAQGTCLARATSTWVALKSPVT